MTSRFKQQLIFLLLIFWQFLFSNEQKEILTCKVHIKVLLDEIESNEQILKISSKNGIKLRNQENKAQTFKNEIKLNFDNNQITLNNQKTDNKILEIIPINGYIKINNYEYQGTIFILNDKNKLQIINKVELEDYIFSVLKTESWPGWPLEINKVLAIAARSYAIAKFLESKNKEMNYHIKNTNKHQTYTGVHNSSILRDAVRETEGMVLGYKNKPILAMFDICCGGIIPANIHHVNFEHAPYLKRKEPCNFCKSYKHYSWNVEFEKRYMEEILKNEFPKLKNLKRISITKKDNAGIVKQIEISDKKNYFYINSKKFYSLLKNIKSHCYSFVHRAEKIIIKGKGFGHHLGICQWGAREMVNQGWDYKNILKFYYPGTNFMKLKVKI